MLRCIIQIVVLATIFSCRKMWHVFCWRQCFRHNWKFSKYYSVLSSFNFSKLWLRVAFVYCRQDCRSTRVKALWTRPGKLIGLGSVLLLLPLAVESVVIAENRKDVGLGLGENEEEVMWGGLCTLLRVHQHKCAELALVCIWDNCITGSWSTNKYRNSGVYELWCTPQHLILDFSIIWDVLAPPYPIQERTVSWRKLELTLFFWFTKALIYYLSLYI